jgi:hypothetical protein
MPVTAENSLSEAGGRTAARLFDAGGESLDAAVAATVQALALRGNARCLVCGETLVRTDEGDALCGSCGSRLD